MFGLAPDWCACCLLASSDLREHLPLEVTDNVLWFHGSKSPNIVFFFFLFSLKGCFTPQPWSSMPFSPSSSSISKPSSIADLEDRDVTPMPVWSSASFTLAQIIFMEDMSMVTIWLSIDETRSAIFTGILVPLHVTVGHYAPDHQATPTWASMFSSHGLHVLRLLSDSHHWFSFSAGISLWILKPSNRCSCFLCWSHGPLPFSTPSALVSANGSSIHVFWSADMESQFF